jgi:hypothetical protein
MALSLGDAAKAIGTTRTKIFWAIKSGRMSATRDAEGFWQIDPAELFRVFPPVEARTGDSPFPFSLGDAAKAIGTTRTAIFRAIKTGRMSATRDAEGVWEIDPVELYRAFPSVEAPAESEHDTSQFRAQIEEAALAAQIAALRKTAELLRARLDGVRKDRDQWRDHAHIVSGPPVDPTHSMPAPPSRSWWRRLAG